MATDLQVTGVAPQRDDRYRIEPDSDRATGVQRGRILRTPTLRDWGRLGKSQQQHDFGRLRQPTG